MATAKIANIAHSSRLRSARGARRGIGPTEVDAGSGVAEAGAGKRTVESGRASQAYRLLRAALGGSCFALRQRPARAENRCRKLARVRAASQQGRTLGFGHPHLDRLPPEPTAGARGRARATVRSCTRRGGGQGAIVSIRGRPGEGKTTLLAAACGLAERARPARVPRARQRAGGRLRVRRRPSAARARDRGARARGPDGAVRGRSRARSERLRSAVGPAPREPVRGSARPVLGARGPRGSRSAAAGRRRPALGRSDDARAARLPARPDRRSPDPRGARHPATRARRNPAHPARGADRRGGHRDAARRAARPGVRRDADRARLRGAAGPRLHRGLPARHRRQSVRDLRAARGAAPRGSGARSRDRRDAGRERARRDRAQRADPSGPARSARR